MIRGLHADGYSESTQNSSLIEILDSGWPTTWSCPDISTDATPTESISHIAQAGFAGLAVPTAFRGAGATLLEVAAAQRSIAVKSPGVGIGLNMHSVTIGMIREYWEREGDVAWLLLEGVAESGSLVASAFAEPGGTPNMLSANAVARRTETGYSITGVKFPCSLATTARLFCVNARLEDEDRIIVALVPNGSSGLTISPGWESLGMRDSDTGRVEFSDVDVDDRLVFYSAPADKIDHLVVAGLVWFSVLTASTYHGLMTRFLQVLSEDVDCKSPERRVLLGSSLADVMALATTCQGLALGWQSGTLRGDAALVHAVALRTRISGVRERLQADAAAVAGSRLYSTDNELSRLSIDLAAVDHHPPGLLTSRLALGGVVAGERITLAPHSRI